MCVHMRGCVLAACLMKLVRRQRPVAELVAFLQKERDTQEKHRNFKREQQAIREAKRLQELPKAARRRELARIQHEKRLAAQASVEQEIVQNPLAGSVPRSIDADSGMETPKKNRPDGLRVRIPGSDEDLADAEDGNKEVKQRQKEVKKRAREEKKRRKMTGQSGDGAPSRRPLVARQKDGFEVEDGTLGRGGHVAALSMISGFPGDVSEQLANFQSLGDLEALDSLEALGDIGGADV